MLSSVKDCKLLHILSFLWGFSQIIFCVASVCFWSRSMEWQIFEMRCFFCRLLRIQILRQWWSKILLLCLLLLLFLLYLSASAIIVIFCSYRCCCWCFRLMDFIWVPCIPLQNWYSLRCLSCCYWIPPYHSLFDCDFEIVTLFPFIRRWQVWIPLSCAMTQLSIAFFSAPTLCLTSAASNSFISIWLLVSVFSTKTMFGTKCDLGCTEKFLFKIENHKNENKFWYLGMTLMDEEITDPWSMITNLHSVKIARTKKSENGEKAQKYWTGDCEKVKKCQKSSEVSKSSNNESKSVKISKKIVSKASNNPIKI